MRGLGSLQQDFDVRDFLRCLSVVVFSSRKENYVDPAPGEAIDGYYCFLREQRLDLQDQKILYQVGGDQVTDQEKCSSQLVQIPLEGPGWTSSYDMILLFCALDANSCASAAGIRRQQI